MSPGSEEKTIDFETIETSAYGVASSLDQAIQDAAEDGTVPDPYLLRQYEERAAGLEQMRKDFFNGLTLDEGDQYENAGEVFHTIAATRHRALDMIPFEELDYKEVEILVRTLFAMNRLMYLGLEGGYLRFGVSDVYMEIPEPVKHLRQMARDHELVLTEDQERAVFQWYRGVYKIHLQVPQERQMEVLDAFVSQSVADGQIAEEIIAQKEAAGAFPSAKLLEQEEAGARLVRFTQWKMRHPKITGKPDFATFVFRVIPLRGEDPLEVVERMAGTVADICGPFDLPDYPLPRHSTPVILGDEEVPGLSYTQGNGDFKDYLIRTGGKEKLARYYDESTNYALEKEED